MESEAKAPAVALLEEEQGDFCFMDTGSEEDQTFDEIVGCLSDILVGPEFENLQNQFYARYCNEFEASEENKLIYTSIYNEWVQTIESALESALRNSIPNFSMQEFIQMVATRQDQITDDVFELLCTFGDFETFKQNMIAVRQSSIAPATSFGFEVHAVTFSRDM